MRRAEEVLPTHECELLLSHLLRLPRYRIYLDDPELKPETVGRFWGLVVERRAGVPIQYILGTTQFLDMELEVRPGVFIPRVETEELVELITLHYSKPAERGEFLGMDLGTGSGCIVIALARAFPNSQWVAVDLKALPLAVARRNARRYGVAPRIRFVRGDLFHFPGAQEYRGRVDLVVTNPPYILRRRLGSLPREVRKFEPREALDGGPDGTAVIRRVLNGAEEFLCPGGELWIEIDPDLVGPIRSLIPPGYGPPRLFRDLGGDERFVRLVRETTQGRGELQRGRFLMG